MATYNLSTIVGKAVNLPVSKKDETGKLPPLYRRVDGYDFDKATDLEGGSASSFKDPLWQRDSKKILNSPTNVRRLFIGGSVVEAGYYIPLQIEKQASSHICLAKKYFGGENFSFLSQQALSNNMAIKASDQVIIKGNPFRALAFPYSLSNIEEVYISSALISETNPDTSGLISLKQKIEELGANSKYIKQVRGAGLLESLAEALSINISDIPNKLPRLRYVGMVYNLDQIIASRLTSYILLRSDLRARLDMPQLSIALPERMEDLNTKWVNEIQLLADHNELGDINTAIIYEQVELNTDEEKKDQVCKFNTRPGIYYMDQAFLENHFAEYTKRALQIARGDNGSSDKNAEEMAHSNEDLMEYLKSKEQAFGKRFVTYYNITMKTFVNSDQEVIKSLIDKDFKSKYSLQ